MDIRRIARPLLLAAPTLVLVGTAVGGASARGGDVKATGTCTAGSRWELKAGPRNGGIETEYEVDSNRVGQSWTVRISDNGVQVFAGTRTTLAPSGSFSVSRRIANRAGTDRITATAVNARTGERCTGTVRV